MNYLLLFTLLSLATLPGAEERSVRDGDRRIMQFLQKLSSADIGKKLKGVPLEDETVALAGHELLHRMNLTSSRAHVYVLRKGSMAMGMPVAYAWVEAMGQPLSKPKIPAGEWREAAYLDEEVYTYSKIEPGIGLVELSCPTTKWIKSLQEPRVAAGWGVESMARIDDPDGFTNVRDENGNVIATVKTEERFLAVKPYDRATQYEVHLASGLIGLMHESRIRRLPDEPLMKLNFEPWKALWSEELGRREKAPAGDTPASHPDAYYPTLLRAAGGDPAALSRFFEPKFEDVMADCYVRDAWKLLHLAGDTAFAEMLAKREPLSSDVGAMFLEEWTTAPISDGKAYLKRHFPQSWKSLFGTK